MSNRDPPGRTPGQPPMGDPPTSQPPTGGQPRTTQPQFQQEPPQSAPVGEMTVSTPTLRWVSIASPQQTVALTERDYVLDSVFNPQQGVWEVLVLVRPTESDEEEDEEE